MLPPAVAVAGFGTVRPLRSRCHSKERYPGVTRDEHERVIPYLGLKACRYGGQLAQHEALSDWEVQ